MKKLWCLWAALVLGACDAEAPDSPVEEALYSFNDKMNLSFFPDQGDLSNFESLGAEAYDEVGIQTLVALAQGAAEGNPKAAWEMCYPGIFQTERTRFMDCLVGYRTSPDQEKLTLKQHQVDCREVDQNVCFRIGNGVREALKSAGGG